MSHMPKCDRVHSRCQCDALEMAELRIEALVLSGAYVTRVAEAVRDACRQAAFEGRSVNSINLADIIAKVLP